MADAMKRTDRLSPSLIYAFRAAHLAKDSRRGPQMREEMPGGASQRKSRTAQRQAINEASLRREVLHDLETLLNCVALESSVDLSDFPKVRKSILNYGFPDIARRTIDELEAEGLETEIEKILKTYEPRLNPQSLRVARDRNFDSSELKVRYLVRADLICKPLNVPMEYVAEVEVTTGKIQLFQA
jgi:type VI secretion system protein ImpF